MHILSKCDHCNGIGYFDCSCLCDTCNGKVFIICAVCSGTGLRQCSNCHGTGRTWLMMNCSHCRGRGNFPCHQCSGKGDVLCPRCRGNKHSYNCNICHGKGRYPCQQCNARGKLPNTELLAWSIDKLKFEYEKRQREILPIQSRVEYLYREANRHYDEYQEAFNRRSDNAYRGGVYHDPGPNSPPSFIGDMEREAGRLSALLEDMRIEMEAIEQALHRKW